MATTNYKLSIERFLRRMGEGSVTINLASISTSYGKFTTEQIYDYFLESGQCLFRAIDRYTKGEVYKYLPNLYKRVLDQALTSGSYTPTQAIERIVDPVIVVYGTSPEVRVQAVRVPENLLESVINSLGHKTITSSYPGYYLEDTSIKVFPDSATKITFRYIQSIPRRILAPDPTNDDNLFPANFSSMIIDGAVMIAKGDTNDISLENWYMSKLEREYSKLAQPISHNKNLLIEQE
jgi:hypothetical protein